MSEPIRLSELLLAEVWRLADLNVDIDAEPVPSVERHYRDRSVAAMSDKQIEIERKRGDFFRDMLSELYGCPPPSVHPMCNYGCGCPFADDDMHEEDAADCWDDVAARAVGGHDEQT